MLFAAGEDGVTFSFGSVVDQIKRSLGASSACRWGGGKGVHARGPAPSRLPRGSLPPPGAPRASIPMHRVQAVNGGASVSCDAWREGLRNSSESHARGALTARNAPQTGPRQRAAAQLPAR